MSVKIRLQRKGRRKQPFYHIVVADARAPRDGRFIEKIGSYNPMTSPATIELDSALAAEWLFKGAQPTDTARAILRFKGVLYLKHLNRGVKKGAFTQEVADKMYEDFMANKSDRLDKRIADNKQASLDRMKAISGAAKAFVPVAEEPVEEEAPAASEEATESVTVAETVVEKTEEVVETVVEKIEEVVEAVAEKAEKVAEVVAEKTDEVVEAVAEKVEKAKEVATEVVEDVKKAAEDAAEDVKEA